MVDSDAARLAALMRRQGLTDPALAEMAGTTKQTIYKLRKGKQRLSKEWAMRLAPHLHADWHELLGRQPEPDQSDFDTDPRDPNRDDKVEEANEVEQGEITRRNKEKSELLARSTHNFYSKLTKFKVEMSPEIIESLKNVEWENFKIPEYSARVNAEIDAKAPEPGIDDAPSVLAIWQVPADYWRAFVSHPAAVCFIQVVGDSMEPEYPSGERVAVDTSHTVPSPPGVYVVWDGFAFTLKRVELLLGTAPPVVRLSSNNPAYPPYERPAADVHISGRVLGKWAWK